MVEEFIFRYTIQKSEMKKKELKKVSTLYFKSITYDGKNF